MPQKCSVINCSNSNKSGFCMVGFPRNAKLREDRTATIGQKAWTPRTNARICEVHFKSSDCGLKFGSKKRKYLKACALPTKNDSSQAVISSKILLKNDNVCRPANRDKVIKSHTSSVIGRSGQVHEEGLSKQTNKKVKVKLQELESDLTMEQSELSLCQEMLEAELIALNQFLLWRQMELGELERNSEQNLTSK